MVRTRSGKATTNEEKKEVKPTAKKVKSPKTGKRRRHSMPVHSMTNDAAAAAHAHVSFDKDVNDQPGKAYLKSPKVKDAKSFSFSADGSRWAALKAKFNGSPFFFVASLTAMGVLLFSALSVWTQLGGRTDTTLQFLFLVLAIHQVDVVANLCNELLDGDMHSDAAFFFTEAGMNVSEVMLFLYSVHPTGSPSFVAIALVVGCMFPACWMNVRFRDDDKIWVRCLAYSMLIGTVAANWETIMADQRLFCYSSFVVYAMTMDIFDFPDNYISFQWCDGTVMLLRAVGCYMLITHEVLKGSVSDKTVHETELMKLMGF